MKTYDWIVVGGGLAGATLSYELQKRGFAVLLLEQFATPPNATRYSYGGIAYWSGTTPLTRQLCQESLQIHYGLSEELGGETQFQERDLLLTISPTRDPEEVVISYRHFAIPPKLLTAAAACELEPLLNRQAIGAALHLRHGHVSPQATVQAYHQAFLRQGGESQIAPVTGLLRQNQQVTGVQTTTDTIPAANVAICAGALSRALMGKIGIPTRLYFSHAEIIDVPSVEFRLRSLIMPAELKRFDREAQASAGELDPLWDQPGHEVTAPILDVGIIQFQDRRLRIGQMTRFLTQPDAPVDAAASEAVMRAEATNLIPAIQGTTGEWHRCLVSFSSDRLPLVGTPLGIQGLHLFTGFSNPFALLPPIARRFARHVAGNPDDIIGQLSPDRFSS